MSTGDKAVNYLSMGAGGLVGLAVGWLVYRRTMARADELAAEDQQQQRRRRRHDRGEGSDDDDGEEDTDFASLEAGTAALMVDDDDISLWEASGGYAFDDGDGLNGNGDGGGRRDGYRDDLTDEVEMKGGIVMN